MYKKRFSKWGFHKNARRVASEQPISSARTKDAVSTPQAKSEPAQPVITTTSLSTLPALSDQDTLAFKLLSNVRTCTTAFFEAPLILESALACDICYDFKLAVDLLDRGYGELAGRSARKGFLYLEDICSLEDPALVWNVLEIMHHLLKTRHLQLFQMVLAHITSLVGTRMPATHPLPVMLRALQSTVVAFRKSSQALCKSSHSEAGLFPAKPPNDAELNTFIDSFSSLLEQGWILNAEILFKRFNIRLMGLYTHVHWDNCSIKAPIRVFETTNSWFSQIDGDIAWSKFTEIDALPILPKSANEICLYHMLDDMDDNRKVCGIEAPSQSGSELNIFAPECDKLREGALTSLWQHWNDAMSHDKDRGPLAKDTGLLMRALAGLFKESLFDSAESLAGSRSASPPTSANQPSTSSSPTSTSTTSPPSTASSTSTPSDDFLPTTPSDTPSWRRDPRFYSHPHRLHNISCVLSTFLDMPASAQPCFGTFEETTVEVTKTIINLRNYSLPSDPSIIHELWRLEDALTRLGRAEEAMDARDEARRRCNLYVSDIPVGVA
jgi:hypothetical protein